MLRPKFVLVLFQALICGLDESQYHWTKTDIPRYLLSTNLELRQRFKPKKSNVYGKSPLHIAARTKSPDPDICKMVHNPPLPPKRNIN